MQAWLVEQHGNGEYRLRTADSAVVGGGLPWLASFRSACLPPVAFGQHIAGTAFKSGAVQVVQDLRLLCPATMAPRLLLDGEVDGRGAVRHLPPRRAHHPPPQHTLTHLASFPTSPPADADLDQLGEALYIPVHDLLRPPGAGPAAVLEALLPAQAPHAFLAADLLSFLSASLATLHLSVSFSPLPQPIRRSALSGRRARPAPDDSTPDLTTRPQGEAPAGQHAQHSGAAATPLDAAAALARPAGASAVAAPPLPPCLEQHIMAYLMHYAGVLAAAVHAAPSPAAAPATLSSDTGAAGHAGGGGGGGGGGSACSLPPHAAQQQTSPGSAQREEGRAAGAATDGAPQGGGRRRARPPEQEEGEEGVAGAPLDAGGQHQSGGGQRCIKKARCSAPPASCAAAGPPLPVVSEERPSTHSESEEEEGGGAASPAPSRSGAATPHGSPLHHPASSVTPPGSPSRAPGGEGSGAASHDEQRLTALAAAPPRPRGLVRSTSFYGAAAGGGGGGGAGGLCRSSSLAMLLLAAPDAGAAPAPVRGAVAQT